MNLAKDLWTKEDIIEFQEYLKTFSSLKNIERTKRIINTRLPVLSIYSEDIRNIVKEISKGNYISFLDLMIWEYHENTIINGLLISKIKDFNIFKHYLDIYSEKIDNWASCDTLKINIKNNEDNYFNLVNEYIKSSKPFKRRIGIFILFKFISEDEYIDKIFKITDMFTNEEEYYVNMVNAWLLCECFIKRRDKTLEYLANNKLNKFTNNKCIQKCRESFRVSGEDKEMLLKYKK